MKHYEENYNEAVSELYQEEILLKENKSLWKDHPGKPRTKSTKSKKDIRDPSKKVISKSHYSSWIFPQILAHFGNKKLFFKESKVSPSLTLERWKLDSLEKTWLEYITSSPRSNFLESSKNPNLSQAVPLVLSAFKTYQNVDYENWDFSDPFISHFLEPLHREILPFRDHNLPDPQTLDWNTLEAKLDGYPRFGEWEAHTLGTMPRLAKYVYTQTWLWHHTKLHNLAIQSLKNWDHAEKSIHNSTIFV